MWLLLSKLDRVTDAVANMRWFPFNTVDTSALDLFFRGYAAGGLKSTSATMDITIPAAAKFAAKSINKITNGQFALANTANLWTSKARESTSTATLISYKLTRDTYGGNCCKSATCTNENSIQKCNLDQAADRIKPFQTNGPGATQL